MNEKCAYLGNCGGCFFINKTYQDQLIWKKEKLKKIFSLNNIEIIPSEKEFSYRNRIDIPITTNGIGFKKKGSWKKIVSIEGCLLFGERSFYILKQLDKFISDFNLEPWDLKKHKGFLRYIVLREGKFTNELMINIITSNERELPEQILDYFKADSVYWCVNDKITDVSRGEIKKFWKNQFIKEKLNGITYFLGPNSFFQTNPFQTQNIIEYVSSLAQGKILEAYCGIGTFSIYLSKKGFDVEGFDIDKEAIEIAKKNALYNNVNVNFFVNEDRKVEKIICDSLILDPPRPGLHKKFLSLILKDKPKNIIYVSCNPESLKRDIDALAEIYKLEDIKAFDMFPQTQHTELVAKLRIK